MNLSEMRDDLVAMQGIYLGILEDNKANGSSLVVDQCKFGITQCDNLIRSLDELMAAEVIDLSKWRRFRNSCGHLAQHVLDLIKWLSS